MIERAMKPKSKPKKGSAVAIQDLVKKTKRHGIEVYECVNEMKK